MRVLDFEMLPPFLHYLALYELRNDFFSVILNLTVLVTIPIHQFMIVTLKEGIYKAHYILKVFLTELAWICVRYSICYNLLFTSFDNLEI